MTAWYNEIDNYAADWLENLIAAGEIAPGIVDRRPIQEIEAYELAGFTQCHFFAGIGVWSGALRAAGWADDRPIWTGSCPCQPFSNAGKQKGFSDERHLWPVWFDLIAQQKPDVIVGEQVDGAFEWIDLVSTNLEAENYAFGAGVICAAGFEGAHIRHRNYFVALGKSDCAGSFARQFGSTATRQGNPFIATSNIERLADSSFTTGQWDTGSLLGSQEKIDRENRAINGNSLIGFADGSNNGGLADDDEQQRNRSGDARSRRWGEFTDDGEIIRAYAPMLGRTPVDWLYCRDGKWRPVEPGTFPLVNETPARVGRLRAYGNALDFETAKNFCIAVKEICDENGV